MAAFPVNYLAKLFVPTKISQAPPRQIATQDFAPSAGLGSIGDPARGRVTRRRRDQFSREIHRLGERWLQEVEQVFPGHGSCRGHTRLSTPNPDLEDFAPAPVSDPSPSRTPCSFERLGSRSGTSPSSPQVTCASVTAPARTQPRSR